MTGRDRFTAFRARMDALGFRPSSVLGQNFLLDPSLHRWLAAAAGAGARDTVVEIGAGLGFLTRELAAVAAAVFAVEIDERLLRLAQDDLAGQANIVWLHADALGGRGRTLHPDLAAAMAAEPRPGGRVLVVANLPYSVSGPLLAELAAAPRLPARCVVLVQKELAQRVVARCGSPDYGGLSAGLQALFVARSLRDVPPQVFRPRPKVTSAVLELTARTDGPLVGAPAADRASFGRFVRHVFMQRRKTLRTTLPSAVAAIGGRQPALDAGALAQRAEQVSPDQLVAWWRQATAGPTDAWA